MSSENGKEELTLKSSEDECRSKQESLITHESLSGDGMTESCCEGVSPGGRKYSPTSSIKQLPEAVFGDVANFLEKQDKLNAAFAGIPGTRAELTVSFASFEQLEPALSNLVVVTMVEINYVHYQNLESTPVTALSEKGCSLRGINFICVKKEGKENCGLMNSTLSSILQQKWWAQVKALLIR